MKSEGTLLIAAAVIVLALVAYTAIGKIAEGASARVETAVASVYGR